ncbi:cytochrome c oxidase subunit 3 [Stutzerimonas stutzeri]|uniref:cytochrome c oxidase subunit 3 n=1 Tax=Stutzerimonas stutzeri TaxID=316 RepID=UPI000C9C31F4|nr:cytochrome c oxidase subunit 3 [Stutzerimonas stutzeri]PNG15082.1 cytochrome c oxidase polypeptide III [Stutzerimonas stutzeri]
MDVRKGYLAEQFSTASQQREATYLGMWLFLSTEIMMFGALFLVIGYYRLHYPQPVAEAVHHLHFVLAGCNSALLLTASLCMSLVVKASRQEYHRHVQLWLVLAALLGLGFLGLKGFEYAWEYREGLLPGSPNESPLTNPGSRLYMVIYLFSTALHALHVSIAVVLALGMAARIHFGHMKLPERAITLEMVGLYWHLVDVIWILLYPALYLLGRPA